MANKLPAPSHDDIGDVGPWLRLGLQEEAEPHNDSEATLLMSAPAQGTGENRKKWEPPTVEELRKLLPQYEIDTFIARGGMGAVYKGTQTTLRRTVAIKVLPPDVEDDHDMHFVERFKHEAQAMARLSHPNIVAVHDAGETPGGLLYFVMEFVEGTDIGQVLTAEGRLPPERATHIITAVCEALAFAHDEGIIHRDIKPSNIMLDRKGRVKVADFGLAKAVNIDSTLLTGSNIAMGTPDFIAPEAMIPGIRLDQRADIYAVGVMLYQMLTGNIPRGRFALPSGVVPQINKGFDAIVDKAMQTDREKRYSTALEIKKDVESVPLETRDPAAIPLSVSTVPRRQSKWLIPGVVATIMVIGAAVTLKQKSAIPNTHSDPTSVSRASTSLPPLPVSIEARAIRLWDSAKTVTGSTEGVAWENEALRLDKRGVSPPNLSVRDIVVRMSVLANPDCQNTKVNIRRPKQGARGSRGYVLVFKPAESVFHLSAVAENSAKTLAKWPFPRAYAANEWIKLEFRAVGEMLTVAADGEVLGAVRDNTLSQPGTFELYADSKGYFRDISYIPLDGVPEAEALKVAEVAPTSSPPSLPVAQSSSDGWRKVDFAKLDPAAAQQGTLENGVLRLKDFRFWRWEPHTETWRNGAIRATIPWEGAATKSVQVTLRHTTQSNYQVRLYSHMLVMASRIGRQPDVKLTTFPVAPLLQPGTEVTVQFAAIGSVLAAWVNGRLLGQFKDTTIAAQGLPLLQAEDGLFKDIAVLNLDSLPEAEALKVLGVDGEAPAGPR